MPMRDGWKCLAKLDPAKHSKKLGLSIFTWEGVFGKCIWVHASKSHCTNCIEVHHRCGFDYFVYDTQDRDKAVNMKIENVRCLRCFCQMLTAYFLISFLLLLFFWFFFAN